MLLETLMVEVADAGNEVSRLLDLSRGWLKQVHLGELWNEHMLRDSANACSTVES